MSSSNKKPSLRELKASRAFKLLNTKDLLDMHPPSQAELEEFETRVTVLNRTANSAVAGAVLTSFVGLLAMLNGLITLAIGTYLDGAAPAIGGALAVVAAMLLVAPYEDVPSVKEHTGKLASREACDRALLLTERYAQANSYREAVLAQSRALHMLDLALMEVICKQAEIQQEAELTKQRCQKLHGISA